jgi:hypothetical protein
MRNGLAGLFLVSAAVVVSCGGGGSSQPMPPSCEDACPMSVATGCPLAPPTQADCLSGCQAIRAMGCTAQYDAFARCAGPMPVLECDSSGEVTAPGCMTESAAIYTCLSGR